MQENNQSKDLKQIAIFVDNDETWGGTFQYTSHLIQAIKEIYDPSYISIIYTKTTWKNRFKELKHYYFNLNFFKRILIYIGIYLDIKKINFFLHKIFFSKKNYQILKKENLICFFPSQDILFKLFSGKKIVSVHDLMHLHSLSPEVAGYFKKKFRNFRYRQISIFADKVLTDSEYGKNQFIDDFQCNEEKIFVKKFFVKKVEKFEIVKNLPNKFLIYPAQFWPHKNHLKLIEAVSIVSKNTPDIRLILTGYKNKEYKTVKNTIERLKISKNILFLDYINEEQLAYIYSKARGLVLPTFFGPTNIPPIEALLYDCPIMISDIFASRQQCKEAAIYFNPHNPKDIAEKINEIWNDDKKIEEIKKFIKEYKKEFDFNNYKSNLHSIILPFLKASVVVKNK